MADYAADAASGTAGTALTTRTGTAAADTVPAGAYVVWQNSGAGAHTVTLGNNFMVDGLPVTGRVITIPAGQVWGGRVNALWGDANGRVSVAINGTASEVTYRIIGNI
jgi:hypothetical protein